MYHRVAVEQFDPWELCVTPEHFADHVDVLAASGRRVFSVTDLVAGHRAGTLPKGAIAISFDDGYVDNLRVAAPTLAQRDLPATVFVATAAMGSGRMMWWDELGDVLGHDPAEYERRWRAMLELGEDERRGEMDSVLDGRSIAGSDDRRMMNREEVRTLDRDTTIEVGSHTVTHSSLPTLSMAARDDELRRSRHDLEELLERRVETLAYPYGHTDASCAAAARAAGYTAAVTTVGAPVRAADDPLLVPRFLVPDLDGDAFARFLAERG